MSDICHVAIDIWGEPMSDLDLIVRYSADADAGPLVLSGICPEPDGITQEHQVEWRSLHWGCKWEPDNATLERVDGGIRYRCETAPGPPTYWCETVSALFPRLSVRVAFVAPDLPLAGSILFREGMPVDGETVSDEIPAYSEQWWGDAARILGAVTADALVVAARG